MTDVWSPQAFEMCVINLHDLSSSATSLMLVRRLLDGGT